MRRLLSDMYFSSNTFMVECLLFLVLIFKISLENIMSIPVSIGREF